MISLHDTHGEEFLLNEDCIEAVFKAKKGNGSCLYSTIDPGACWEVAESIAEVKQIINDAMYGI